MVPVGANRKWFHVVKSGKKDDETGLNSELEGLSPSAQTAVKAVGRILAPHADEITDRHIDAVQSAVGIGGSERGGDEMAEKVKPEHMKSAMEMAKKAYKSAMSKLGYQKYPEGELQMKGYDPEALDEGDKDEKEKAAKAKKEEDKVGKESILKEDGSINLDAVPNEMRPFAEMIAKQHTEMQSKIKAAETRAENSEKVLKEQKEAFRKSEIVQKAAKFTNLKTEDVQKTLELADKAGAEEFDRVLKMFEAQDKLLGESAVFKEIGSAMTGTPGSVDAWSKIEKAAETVVQKSAEAGKAITKEMAIADFMATPEGQKLYAQHQAARPNGI